MKAVPQYPEGLQCTGCGSFPESSDEEVLEIDSTGDLACMNCQLDACANFGQDFDNIKHTRMLGRLVLRFWEE